MVIKQQSFWFLLKLYWHLILDERSWIFLFTGIRFVLNTSGPFLVYHYLLKFDVLTSAFASGLTGVISALFQFYNEKFIDWLNLTPQKYMQCLKWYGVEITFLLVPYFLVFYPQGIFLNSNSLKLEVISLFTTAFYALVSQGVWDLSLAYQKGLNQKKEKFNPTKLKVIFNFRFLIVSFISVICSIIKLSNPNLGKILFVFFMLAGVIFYLYVWLDKRLKEVSLSYDQTN